MNQLLRATELKEKILEFEQIKTNVIDCANFSISVCRDLLGEFKKEIVFYGFQSVDEEINFFKNIKQIPLKELIYFSEVRSFEIQFPKANAETQRKFIKKKLNKLNRFFLYNMDFGQYVESGATHFDKEFYTRSFLDGYYITTSKFYFQDPDFFTPRDMLLGKFRAYNQFIVYLDNRLFKLENTHYSATVRHSNKKLQWPFSNTAYVELLYALCLSGLGKEDRQSIMKVSQKIQQIIDFKPKDIYKTFQEIKSRKKSKTLFLDELAETLLLEIDKSEE